MARYPNDPSKYRRVNQDMDKELVHYKKEIESRFKKSDMRLYQFNRTLLDQDSEGEIHGGGY